jgi:hypothetical protein
LKTDIPHFITIGIQLNLKDKKIMFLNNKKYLIILVWALIMLTSCSNNNDGSPDHSAIATILDKWWYPTYSGSNDFYIHSDGRYEQRDADTNVITSTGNWILVKEEEDLATIKVDYDENTNQHYKTVWFQFYEIQEHSFSIVQSYDGINFGIPSLIYQDTDKIFP